MDHSGTLSYTELFDLLVKSGVSRTSAELWAKNFFEACGIHLTQEDIEGYAAEEGEEGGGEEDGEWYYEEEGDGAAEGDDEAAAECEGGECEEEVAEEEGEGEGDAEAAEEGCEGDECAAEEEEEEEAGAEEEVKEISFAAFMAEYARMQTLRVVEAFQKQVTSRTHQWMDTHRGTCWFFFSSF